LAILVWIWLVFIFAFGCCVGSFLNVVIYRLPRDKSLITPPSNCPACGKRIRFYDNIPLISWLALGRKCRYCKAAISPRYFVVELLTGLVFSGLFVLYFVVGVRHFEIGGAAGLAGFVKGGWFIYLLYITLLACLIAASAIDLELWVIPVFICWLATAVGLVGSAIGYKIIDYPVINHYRLLPLASANIAALAAGAAIGLMISLVLLKAGLVKRSYLSEDERDLEDKGPECEQDNTNHRLEMVREIVFLLPVIVCSLAALHVSKTSVPIQNWWVNFTQRPVIAGFMGSLWGYFVGCGVVWATRIFGTLAFGREAMGLGDVHLMGAAGAVIGGGLTVVAFFIAPFFGLVWAGIQMFFKKTRQIPYGPFLSLGILVVMILHDWILGYWNSVLFR